MRDCHDISILIPEDPKVGVGAVIWSTCQSVSSSVVYKPADTLDLSKIRVFYMSVVHMPLFLKHTLGKVRCDFLNIF